nr:phosphoenolpyruvate--protein phosphotransferase [uncultured Acetatifactor sp.]
MMQLLGKAVSGGIVLGPIFVPDRMKKQIHCVRITDAEAEIDRVRAAVKQVKVQLQALYDRALEEAGESGAAIFEAYELMLEDEDYLEAIYNDIRMEKVSGARAVAAAGEHFAELFAGMEDEYMRARAADVRDISERLADLLDGGKETDFFPEEPSVIVADDLSPSELVSLDRSKILAFATIQGSAVSHTAILARMMNIPALVEVPVNLEEIHTGMIAAVDGFEGTVTFEPDEDFRLQTEKRMEKEQEQLQRLESLKGRKTATKSGKKIDVYANIGSEDDVAYALENDAEGIGLFRSEFLYLSRRDFPAEEEQFQVYKRVVQRMEGRKVIIRTLDIGADKQADYFNIGIEENPAMGCRAVRICLKQPEIFRIQLRALFRASVFGNLSVMYPMIISEEEVRQILRIAEEVQAELEAEGYPCQCPEQGIMIETPAAVMISDELAELVDFFSIGTNDLTQYTLAIDRQNERLADYYDPHHKAILRMIRMVVENAHKHGIRVGICGELGADTELTEEFVRMGVDELSVAPSMILKVRKTVREIS